MVTGRTLSKIYFYLWFGNVGPPCHPACSMLPEIDFWWAWLLLKDLGLIVYKNVLTILMNIPQELLQ